MDPVEDMGSFIHEWMNEQDPSNRKVNDRNFINNFIAAVDSLHDFSKFQFDGENCYGGRQITIDFTDGFTRIHPKFEAAYNERGLVVYNANHHGFWMQPFIVAPSDSDEYLRIMNSLRSMMRRMLDIPA